MRLRCFFVVFAGLASGLTAQEILRGEVRVGIEPVYALSLGQKSPLNEMDMEMWALEETALSYAAMIYGWAFEYEPGDKARMLAEHIDLKPLGTVHFGDTRMKADTAHIEDGWFSLWTEYHLGETQQQRVKSWSKAGSVELQATGYGNLEGKANGTERSRIKDAALEDAAGKAIREKMRGLSHNRPLRVKGRLALASFPVYGIEGGLWTVYARFRFILDETEQYAAF